MHMRIRSGFHGHESGTIFRNNINYLYNALGSAFTRPGKLLYSTTSHSGQDDVMKKIVQHNIYIIVYTDEV